LSIAGQLEDFRSRGCAWLGPADFRLRGCVRLGLADAPGSAGSAAPASKTFASPARMRLARLGMARRLGLCGLARPRLNPNIKKQATSSTNGLRNQRHHAKYKADQRHSGMMIKRMDIRELNIRCPTNNLKNLMKTHPTNRNQLIPENVKVLQRRAGKRNMS